MGGATALLNFVFFFVVFQSTLPVGGATFALILTLLKILISIHAPRGGSDTVTLPVTSPPDDFNPRSPWGERLCRLIVLKNFIISIHAPRGGSDSYMAALEGIYGYFNPRSPWGERLDSYCAD